MAQVQKLHPGNEFLQQRGAGQRPLKASFPGITLPMLMTSGYGRVLTTDLSMALMRLWLMSSVVRLLQTGTTAVMSRSDFSPSASHWENSLASGTRMACRQPERRDG